MRKLLIMLAVLLTLGLPSALAARTGGLTGEAVCTSLVASGPTSPSAGGGRINLESFVPDPGCWLQDTAREVNNRNLYGFSADIAKFIVVASVLLAGLRAIPSGKISLFLKTLAIGVVVFYAADTYDRKSGIGWIAADTMMGAWTTVYLESSRVGQAMLDRNVLKQVEELDTEFQKFVVSSMTIQGVAGLNGLFGGETDPTMLDSAYQRMQNRLDTRETNPLLGGRTSIAYFLLLGMFSVFAALVYSSGVLVIISIVALPVVLALSTMGSTQFLRTTGVIWLSNLITILILPIFMALLIGTMLKAPIATLKDNLAYNATLATETANQIKTNLDACSGVMFLACKFDRGLDGLIDNAVRGLESSFMGLSVGILAVLVTFTIAMTQLRRIPSTVDRIFGTMGGGESSGVKTDFVPSARATRRVAGSTGQAVVETSRKIVGAAYGKPAASAQGGAQTTKASQAPQGGGSAPSPRTVLNSTLPAPGRKP